MAMIIRYVIQLYLIITVIPTVKSKIYDNTVLIHNLKLVFKIYKVIIGTHYF